MKGIIIIVAILLSCELFAQEPPRKASLGVQGTFSERGLAVDTVLPASTLYNTGITKGDTLKSLNGIAITNPQDYNNQAGSIRMGDKVTISYIHKGRTKTKTAKAAMRPYETSDMADVIYDWVPYKDCMLRTIVRKPKGASSSPAVLLIPGYNCGSIENFSQGIYKHLIEEWLNNGFTVVTIEKSGLGDSYNCEPCMDVDLQTDIETFDAGYRYMEGLPYVDRNNLFIWGHSMGGVIAPVVAEQHKPRGVIAYATVFRPWSEFLPEMHRIQHPLDGNSYTATEEYVRKMHQVYYELFINKKSPDEIRQIPALAETVDKELTKKGETNMWGRHWRYWQQIDSLNLAASWSAVECPVLSVFGGSDFVACSELEHELITRTVNSAHPGNATHITIPDLDHLLTKNDGWENAHKNFMNVAYRQDNFHFGAAKKMTEWMRKQVKK